MVDIVDYPNPLKDEFFSRFPNPTVEDAFAFIDEKLQNSTNLQRLSADGSVTRASIKDERLVLHAGKGDDWVLTFLGEQAITIGGVGRDWIFNTSKGGIIYGDTYSTTVKIQYRSRLRKNMIGSFESELVEETSGSCSRDRKTL